MKRELIITEDGSHTLYIPEMDEQYHSIHGAIQESQHVFIDAGMKHLNNTSINIFEVGLGTGLNAYLTLLEAKHTKQQINYFTIEKYPLKQSEYTFINYVEIAGGSKNDFLNIHTSDWNKTVDITSTFQITKFEDDFFKFEFKTLPKFDLIYFDAFAPNKQSKLWTKKIYKKIVEHCNHGALLVTYCAKGVVRRDLQAVGFSVERLPGPPGKREMLRAFKI